MKNLRNSLVYPSTEKSNIVHTKLHRRSIEKKYKKIKIIKKKYQIQGKDLPVFVFIHGGGYEIGASNHYGYDNLDADDKG